ncbi:MAG: YigZ family protein [Bacilli bacterium]
MKTSYIEIKKSKFYGYAYNVTSVTEVNIILNELKLSNKKSSHIVYAYKINSNIKKYEDKEPSGTSGSQILNIIEKKNLDNILIVVIRYFGGTLLGVGNLAKAYRTCCINLF